MSIDDARVWFRYRRKMTRRVKGNRTSVFRDDMDCRHCDTKEEHLEVCKGTEDIRKDIDMNIEHDKMMFWRKLTRRKNYNTESEHNNNNWEKKELMERWAIHQNRD